MHIGFIAADLHHGHGWGHYSLSLLQALTRQGAQVTVIAPRNSPTDFPFEVLPTLPTLTPAERAQLPKLVLQRDAVRRALRAVDVLHVAPEPFAPLGMWAADGKPYYITAHGSYAQPGISRPRWQRPLYRASFARARAVVCVSHYTQRVLQAALPAVRSVVIGNGVDAARFATLPALEAPPQRPVILTAGGVKRRKGTLALLRAVAVVREQLPDVLCIVIGRTDAEPETTAAARALIATLGLEDNVRLLGFVPPSELLAWYGAADVFALPSLNDGWKFEGYGLVHLEASAAGLPVIGTRDCGAEDAIDDGVTGYLVRQTHIDEDLPAALLRLLQNPALAAQMGTHGRAKAARQTWDAAAVQLLARYATDLEVGGK